MANRTPRVPHLCSSGRGTVRALPARNPGLVWLSRRLAWEQTLADLREPTAEVVDGDDTAAA